MFDRRGICVWLAGMCLIQALQAANVIQGDSSQPGITFNTPIQSVVYNNLWGVAAFGARIPGAKNFALSLFGHGKLRCLPIASEKIKLDNKDDVESPLYDQAISSLAFVLRSTGAVGGMDKLLLSAYTSHTPSTVYLFDDLANEERTPVLSAKDIKDATGDHVTSGVIALCGGANSSVYAAVKNNTGDDFGAVGSGIALLTRTMTTTTQAQGETHRENAFMQIDAEVTSSVSTDSATQTRAAAFDGTMSIIKIGNNATILNNAIDIHWDQNLNCLYVVTQVQAGPDATDGACALVVGNIFRGSTEEGKATSELFQKLQFKRVAGDNAFKGTQDKIVGAIGANARVSLHKVRTLQTSTGLHYVVVLGGNGDAASTRRTVYALPIVNNASLLPLHGVLANKNAPAYDHYQKSEPYRFLGRNFAYPAQSEGDLCTATDQSAMVGGGAVLWGDVTDMWVIADAVFVAVGAADSDQVPGIAVSRALFDESSKIVAWTEWQRVAGSVDAIYYAAMNSYSGMCLMLSGVTQQDLTVLKETSWETKSADGLSQLAEHINNTMLPEYGGVFSVSDFPVSTPGLAGISALIATGNKCLVLAQTGRVRNGVLCPLLGQDAFDALTCAHATIPVDMPTAHTHVLIFEDGVLSQLGPVATTEIASNGARGWLFAGGVGGLAVLAGVDGASWSGCLGDGFTGLHAGAAFKKIGNYTFVRKLLSDDAFLYVLTDDRLDQIDLNASNFATGQLSVVTLASSNNSSLFTRTALLTDFIVSEKIALLGSSFGLFRVGNGVDIRQVKSEAEAQWTPVPLDEGSLCVGMIQAISRTGRVQDCARTGGMIHVLTAYQGNNRSQAYRFRINPVGGGHVDTHAVVPLGDFFVKDQPSYFVDFGGYRDWLFFDGAFFFYGTSRNQPQDPLLRLLPSAVHSGQRFAASSSTNIPLSLQAYASVMPMVRSSATGAWLLPGDFGLKINE